MSIKRVGKGFQFGKKSKKFRKLKREIPKVIAEESLNHYLEGFKQGGGQTDDSKSGWQRRKATAKRNTGRALLVDTGALKRDLQVISANGDRIILGTRRIPYARRHNEGITDRRGRQMPKREFIGHSRELNKSNIKLLNKLIQKAML